MCFVKWFKFSPLVILDGKDSRVIKTLKITNNFGVIFSGQERSSFSNKTIFNHWLETIYMGELPYELRNQTVLILDNSGTHSPGR